MVNRDPRSLQGWAAIRYVATRLGVKRAAIDKWRYRGIAPKWRQTLIDYGHLLEVPIDRALFDPNNVPRRWRSASRRSRIPRQEATSDGPTTS